MPYGQIKELQIIQFSFVVSCLFPHLAASRKQFQAGMAATGTGAWAKVYADVNTHKPRDYWDYESHPIEWG